MMHARTLPLRAATVRAWLLPEILRWREPAQFPREDSVELHLLTSRRDWICAAWALASFVHCSGRRWPIVVHDDGTLNGTAERALRKIFPQLRIVARRDADAEMAVRLAAHPRCLQYRQSHPLALKLLDCTVLARTPRVILLDSDLLFFQRPDEVLAWVQRRADEAFFNPDFQDAYCLSHAEGVARLGVALWPRVNTGLSLLPRAVIDLDFCEACLADEMIDDPESIAWREQTVLALCASRFGAGGLLSSRYEVSFNPRMAANAISRHYVGDIRPMFYTEGVRRVGRQIFA